MSWWVKIFLIIFVVIVGGGSTLVYKGLSLERNISIPAKEGSILQQIKDLVTINSKSPEKELPEEINILLLGIPGKGHSGSDLTDTIIVLMIRPKENKAALLSIPRDLYVKIPELNIGYSRINAVYTYGNEYTHEEGGIGLLKETIKDVTNIHIDNYVILDFNGFVDLVDILGGIEIDNKENIYDSAYPADNFKYQTFKLSAGEHLLDGETALKYVRTRHSSGGDFDRAKRQQEVLDIIKIKMLELNPIFDLGKITKIIDTLGSHVKTDMGLTQIKILYDAYQDNQQNNWQTVSALIDSDVETGVLIESKEPLGTGVADVLKPRLGENNYSEIQEMIYNIFELETWQEKRRQLKTENASLELRYNNNDFESETINALAEELSKFGYIVTIGTISSDELPEETIIYDLSKGVKSYSLNDLKEKLDAKTSAPDVEITSGYDFVVILKN